jgi:hypothetical protein
MHAEHCAQFGPKKPLRQVPLGQTRLGGQWQCVLLDL